VAEERRPHSILDHHPTYVCKDGLWGLREFTLEPHFFDHQSPHLAFFPVPTEPLYFQHNLFRLPSASEYGETGARGRLFLGTGLVRKMGGLLEDISDAAHKGKWWVDTYFKENPDVLEKKSKRVRMLLEGRFPSTVEANMFELMKALADNGVKTKEELILCWVAMQRCARELIAYASFCSNFVQSYACRVELLQRLERLNITEGFTFRGSVFTGSDLPFIDNFLNLNLPAFAYIWCKEYDVNEKRFEKDNEKRSSVDPDSELSKSSRLFCLRPPCSHFTSSVLAAAKLARGKLHTICVPPPTGTPGYQFEPAARGLIPCVPIEEDPAGLGKRKDREDQPAGAKRTSLF
jgi:hypothetical protein